MGDQKYKTRREVELSSKDEFGQLVASLQAETPSDIKPVYVRGKTARFEDKPKDAGENYTTLGRMFFDGVM